MSIIAIVAPYMGAFFAGTTIGGAMGFGLAAILTAGRRADEADTRAMSITTTIDFAGNPEAAERAYAGHMRDLQDKSEAMRDTVGPAGYDPSHPTSARSLRALRTLREAEGYAPPAAPLRLVPRDQATAPPPPRR